METQWGIPEDVDEKRTSVIGTLQERDSDPIGFPSFRVMETKGVGRTPSSEIGNFFCLAARMTRCFIKPDFCSRESSPLPMWPTEPWLQICVRHRGEQPAADLFPKSGRGR